MQESGEEERRAAGFKDVRRPRERKPGGLSERNGGKEGEGGGEGLSHTATSGH